jgi:hypothetical protein
MDFPTSGFHLPVINSLSGLPSSLSAPTSATWPAANRALFAPFTLSGWFSVRRLWWANGGTASGNLDCGIYTENGVRLASTGSTVQAGTNVIQSVVVSVDLPPGSYYLALAASATTVTVLRQTGTTDYMSSMGWAQMATAFALPATATLAALATAYAPYFGMTSASVI